jgi:antirestriction protein ArdC
MTTTKTTKKTSKKKAPKKKATKRDLFAEVISSLKSAMADGVGPWVRPWKKMAASGAVVGAPRNAISGRKYRGGNAFWLSFEGLQRGYADCRWATYKQISQEGGQVRKGETASAALLWKPIKRKMTEKELAAWLAKHPGKSEADAPKKDALFLRSFAVFNIEQAEWPEGSRFAPKAQSELPIAEAPELEFAEAQRLADESGANIRFGGDRAYYAPLSDHIQLPKQAAFETESAFHGTQLHELAHWTGHSSRLDRELLKGRFGDEAYAFEELVAEMTAALLCAHVQVDGQLQHAEYLANWIKVLESDKYAFFTASKKAQEAADYILGLAGVEITSDLSPQPVTEGEAAGE